MLIFEKPDGSIAVMHPVGDVGDAAAFAEQERAKSPFLADATFVGETDVLPDKAFRAAWRHNGGIVVDMPAARDIHMGRIREKRNAKLARLDVETVQAVGKGDNAKRDLVESQKQTLRDLPQTFDLSGATTPDELAALWPAELND